MTHSATHYTTLPCTAPHYTVLQDAATHLSPPLPTGVEQSGSNLNEKIFSVEALCCSGLQYVAAVCSMLQRRIVLQCVAESKQMVTTENSRHTSCNPSFGVVTRKLKPRAPQDPTYCRDSLRRTRTAMHCNASSENHPLVSLGCCVMYPFVWFCSYFNHFRWCKHPESYGCETRLRFIYICTLVYMLQTEGMYVCIVVYAYMAGVSTHIYINVYIYECIRS